MEYAGAFVIGCVFGALLVVLLTRLFKKDTRDIAQELVVQSQYQKIQDLEVLIGNIKESFGSLSHDALISNTQEFLKLAQETLAGQTRANEQNLHGKKQLIDQTLETMKQDLNSVRELVTRLEKDREQKFGEVSSRLKQATEQTAQLQETTHRLREMLASTKSRGQWGERMAEDVLRLAGFIEGVNYVKQKALEAGTGRPDYTFLLPKNLKVNMDVKFPLDNYVRYLESQGESEKEKHKNQFLRDVRNRIKEVVTRDYINPDENTVDYVIVFIPNEQVYAFMNEKDGSIMDDALKNKVILCSPITLYAILAVIRQAVDNFNLEQTAAQIMRALDSFRKQWDAFVVSMEKMGRRIEDAQKEYNNLTTTRRNQLERRLQEIDNLRRLQVGVDEDSEPVEIEPPEEAESS
ncbi:MAG: DNA recombination protein RmuC [Deltaproteobacteria bacterium]|nr:DNA recombination protein RmuC [Deltaproteobacteria bacterium]